MNSAWLLLMLAAFGQVAGDPAIAPPATPSVYPPTTGTDPTFTLAKISSEDVRLISAEVEGVLTQLPVREGMRVAQGQVMAMIDDRQGKAAVEIADYTHQAAVARAEDQIEEIFAKASAEYALVDLQKDLLANQGTPNAVPDIQIRQKKLAYKRAQLQTDKAIKDRHIAGKEADVKKAELKAAQIALDRRTIAAPIDGVVQELMQRESQWVNPGDPILRLVKFDVLRVECRVSAEQFDPIDLANRPVTVRVNLAQDRQVAVEGRVVYVDQTVDAIRGDYLVRAEVQNQRNGDYWLIRPGLSAELTIHTSRPPVEAPAAAMRKP